MLVCIVILKFKFFNSGDIDINQSKSLKCYNGSSPYLYGLLKIHKSNIPICPIINYTSSPLNKLSKFLSNLLTLLTLNSPFSLNSSYKFLKDLKSMRLPPSNYKMASLDVISLYASSYSIYH